MPEPARLDTPAARGFPMNAAYRGRFAPSPTGRLHFGSLVAALGSWLHARAAGGAWLVRIEDLDHEREVPGAARHILATLAALGLHADEPVRVQSQHLDFYRHALERLRDGGHAYPCWCSRSDLEELAGIHPARCTTARGTRTPAWRLRVDGPAIGFDDALCGPFEQDLARELGDFVIWRGDGICAYQLAVVVDDADQGVTDVVRGADLLDSTPRQILLQDRLGLPRPRYLHLPLALDAQGRKLSKHDQARAVDAHDPLPALRAALTFLGQAAQARGSVDSILREAIKDFDPTRIPRPAAATIAAARNATR